MLDLPLNVLLFISIKRIKNINGCIKAIYSGYEKVISPLNILEFKDIIGAIDYNGCEVLERNGGFKPFDYLEKMEAEKAYQFTLFWDEGTPRIVNWHCSTNEWAKDRLKARIAKKELSKPEGKYQTLRQALIAGNKLKKTN